MSRNLTPVVRFAATLRDNHPDTAATPVEDLVAATKDGDHAAAVELIARHVDMLGKLASRANVGAAPLDDLHQEAMLALIVAAHEYDPTRGTGSYPTYAYRVIKCALTDANAAYDGRGVARFSYKLYWQAMAACDNDPTMARRWTQLERLTALELEELAETDPLAREVMNVRVDRWERQAKRDPKTAPQWEEYATRKGRGLTAAEFDAIHASLTYLDATTHSGEPAAEKVTDPAAEDAYAAAELRIAVQEMLPEIEPVHPHAREIITRLHGLDGEEPETQMQIATRLGLSRSNVARIARESYRRLRSIATEMR